MEWESSGVGEWESAVCFFDISDSLDINVCVCVCVCICICVCVCVCVCRLLDVCGHPSAPSISVNSSSATLALRHSLARTIT